MNMPAVAHWIDDQTWKSAHGTTKRLPQFYAFFADTSFWFRWFWKVLSFEPYSLDNGKRSPVSFLRPLIFCQTSPSSGLVGCQPGSWSLESDGNSTGDLEKHDTSPPKKKTLGVSSVNLPPQRLAPWPLRTPPGWDRDRPGPKNPIHRLEILASPRILWVFHQVGIASCEGFPLPTMSPSLCGHRRHRPRLRGHFHLSSLGIPMGFPRGDWGLPEIGGTPSHHPCTDGIFHVNICKPSSVKLGVPLWWWKPPIFILTEKAPTGRFRPVPSPSRVSEDQHGPHQHLPGYRKKLPSTSKYFDWVSWWWILWNSDEIWWAGDLKKKQKNIMNHHLASGKQPWQWKPSRAEHD